MTRSVDTDDRGVSEVVAFVLVFATIIGSVGLLYAVGFQSMTSYQETEQLNNAEGAMDALAENFNDVQRTDAIKERTSELQLREGTIRVDTDADVVTVHTADGELSVSGALRYERDERVLAYEGGGIFRGVQDSPQENVMITRPRLSCNPDSGGAVISLVSIDSVDGPSSIFSADGQELTIVETDREVIREDPDDVEIEITEDAAFENGWEQALERTGWEDGTCDVATGEDTVVTIRHVIVEIEI